MRSFIPHTAKAARPRPRLRQASLLETALFAVALIAPVVIVCAIAAALSFVHPTGVIAAPLIPSMYIAKRTYSQWSTAPVDGGISDMKLNRGTVMDGLLLSIPYSVNVTGAGGAVRARSVPVKRVSIIDQDGKYLYSIKGPDLVTKAMIFEQTPVGALLTPASAAAVANYTNLFAHLPIHFVQPHAANGFRTALPSYAYGDLTLRVEWGSVGDLFTPNALAGTITYNTPTVTQLDYADLAIPNPRGLASQLFRTVDRYVEVVQAALPATDLERIIGNTANIRAALITAELTSTGEPTDTIIDAVTWKENNSVNVFQSVPWQALRADNAKKYGLTLPTGCAVIDFAEDGDIDNIYKATLKDSVSAFLKTLAVAGTIRFHLMTIERPLDVARIVRAA